MAAALKANWGDESLDLGSLAVRLSISLLGTLDLSPDHVFPDIVLLAQVEELPDLGSPLGTQSFGQNDIGQSRNFLFPLPHNDEGENGNIRANDAAANRLATTFSGATDAVAGVAIGEKEANAVGQENALLHGKPLLVVATCNAENITLPFVTQRVSGNFLSHFLVVEDTVSLLIVEINELLCPSRGVSNVELHS